MASLNMPAHQPHSPRRDARHGVASMSTRQLEAYLQAREMLRRLRAATALPADPRHDASPSGRPSA